MSNSCVVIGGGISGLISSYLLKKRNFDVTLIDKGKSLGGRIATRRINVGNENEGNFDYGAQEFYWPVSSPYPQLDELFDQFKDLIQKRFSDSNTMWVSGSTSGLRGITKVLEKKIREMGVTVITGHQVYSTDYDIPSKKWRVKAKKIFNPRDPQKEESPNELTLHGTHLLVSIPIPQALQIIPTNISLPEELKQVTYSKCLALMLMLDTTIGDKSEFLKNMKCQSDQLSDQNVLKLIANNYQKGITSIPYSLTLHSTHDFAVSHWDSPDSIRIPLMLNSLSNILGVQTSLNPQLSVCHRWGFSTPIKTFPSSFFTIPESKLTFVGDGFRDNSDAFSIQHLIWLSTLSGLKGAENLSML